MTAARRNTGSKQKPFDAPLLGTHGPDGVTVEQTPAQAGVATGAVYYHFGSKDGLVRSRCGTGSTCWPASCCPRAEPDQGEAVAMLVGAGLDFLGTCSSSRSTGASSTRSAPGGRHGTRY